MILTISYSKVSIWSRTKFTARSRSLVVEASPSIQFSGKPFCMFYESFLFDAVPAELGVPLPLLAYFGFSGISASWARCLPAGTFTLAIDAEYW